MNDLEIGIWVIVALFTLLLMRIPVGIVMMVTGYLGIAALNGWDAANAALADQTFEVSSFNTLAVIPLFVLMGNLASASGLSKDLFATAYAWIGHRRGGLASATILASSGFAALSGSSLASAVTMGRVALPQMRKYNYADSLATGSVAAGGTLGFLIPPSAGMVIYAILTEQSIGKLFLAGVIPGILLTLLFIVAIQWVVRRNPDAAPVCERSTRKEKIDALFGAIPVLSVILMTIGGIYTGVFTPMEAAGVGAFLTLVFTITRKKLSVQVASTVILQTLQTTGLVFLILIGAHVFIPVMALSQLPAELIQIMTSLDIGYMGILILVLLAYLILGTFLESFSMLVLTLPVVYPLMLELGVDPVWFGIIIVIVLEMGLISPPVGLNVFVVKGIAPDVPIGTIFRGIWPFWFAMAAAIVILIIFPQLALFLPEQMAN